MSVIRNLVIRAGADFSQMKREMAKAQQTMKVFGGQMKMAMAGVAASLAAAGIGVAIKEATSDAMKVEAAMQQLGRTMGGNANEFKNWAEKSALAFNLSRSEAIRFGATYSNLISNFSKDTATTMKYTEELLKSSAIVASATGRDMEDVMDRIRSGMLGETDAIEDLGINVNNAMLLSTDAFKKFANGKSWDKLSYQTQQQILYFGILEQATKKYGTAIADNTASRQQQFIAQLKNTQLSLGQAFLPIYNAVLPALTKMAQSLATTMDYIAQFSQALFGKASATKQVDAQAAAVSGLGDAYTEAGKAATKSVASFDEVNSLADSAGGGSGSTPSGPKLSDLASGTEEMGGVSAKIQELADNFRKALKDFIPEEDKKRLTESLSNLKTSFGELGSSISDLVKTITSSPAIQDFWDKFKSDKAKQLASSIDSISGGIKAWAGTLQLFSGIISGDFEKALGGFEKNISGTYDSITGFIGIFSPETAAKMQSWKQSFSNTWSTLKDEIKKYGDPAKLEALDFAEYIRNKVSTKFGELEKSLTKTWYSIETGIAWDAVKTTIVAYWEEMKGETADKWQEFKTVLSGSWEEVKNYVKWDEIKNTIVTTWENLKNETGIKWDNLKTEIGKKWDLITGIDFTGVNTGLLAIWDDLKVKTGEVWAGIGTTIKANINSVIDLINGFLNKFNGIKFDLPSFTNPFNGEKMGGGSIGMPQIPNIPHLAVGTNYVERSGLAMIHEGEAVVPKKYNPAAGGDDTLVDRMASALGTAVLSAMQMGNSNKGNSGDINLIIDGATIARAIAPYLNKENNRIGGSMITTS
ncbi:hypothetical protein [Paenibacillus anseongense]|uniref:phage tail protein n=1 Tax=Paenibacillus anseongense TaxID=2682845 RepID=UPI002DBA8D56|nr:hypothetical protein [Paenibacillus anseongense]MEC0266707.1 hypothetical protein [Paenibacillus anseongense]